MMKKLMIVFLAVYVCFSICPIKATSSSKSSIIIYDSHGSGNGKYTVTYGFGSVVYTMNATVNNQVQTRTNTWDSGYFRDMH